MPRLGFLALLPALCFSSRATTRGHPHAIIASSKYTLQGPWILQGEADGYPMYRHESGKWNLCHIKERGWFAIEGRCDPHNFHGSISFIWTSTSHEKDPCGIAHGDMGDGIDSFQEVTWGEMDPRYSSHPFTDSVFPANEGSLQIHEEERPAIAGGIEWIRAANLNRDEPEVLISDDISYLDPQQGAIGDCWLVAAMSAAAKGHSHIIEKVFRHHSPSFAATADGKYTASLWDFRNANSKGDHNAWTDVVVDDLLPCKPRGAYVKNGSPLFVSCVDSSPKELWPLILEKAFAKLHGNYGHLVSGSSAYAWQAFGVCHDIMYISWDRANDPFEVWHNDLEAQKKKWKEGERRPLGLQHPEKWRQSEFWKELAGMQHVLGEASCCQKDAGETKKNWGLPGGHAYTILNAMSVSDRNGDTIQLVHLRNPWGDDVVYRGDWGPGSKQWQENPQAKAQVERKVGKDMHEGKDGMFWMKWEHFLYFYHSVELCVFGSIHINDEL